MNLYSKIFSKRIVNFIQYCPSLQRRFFLIILDLLTINISFISLGQINNNNSLPEIINQLIVDDDFRLFIPLITSLITVLIFIITGIYNGLTRYIASRSLYLLTFRTLIATFISFYIFNNFLNANISLNFIFLYFIFSTLLLAFIRIFIRDIYFSASFNFQNKRNKVLIYGSGNESIQLFNFLKYSSKFNVVGFIDNSNNLSNRSISGLRIFSIEDLKKNYSKLNIKSIFITQGKLKKTTSKEIYASFKDLSISILKAPNFDKYANYNEEIDKSKKIEIEDLLGRDVVDPKPEFIEKAIKNKTILVTGGGGSIGGELCRQILQHSPKKLIILERNEYCLYQLSQEFAEKKINPNIMEFFLCDVSNEKFVRNLFERFKNQSKIETVFHAAAYKHVPIVEKNPLIGIHNNILSTYYCALYSSIFEVNNFILISSDKAVRPMNIMGTTKRISEIIIQSFSENLLNDGHHNKTIFSLVRFGNVIGSSGSVINLFKKQIKSGGPLTLTHPEIIRYFMTIKEAVQLVLQTSSLDTSGKIFILDMGDPIKIVDLARQMINLYGLKEKNLNNPNGDIEIVFKGLRPGEKLFEELLIDGDVSNTIHPLIYTSNEKISCDQNVIKSLKSLIINILENDLDKSIEEMKKLVPEWNNKQIFR